MIEAGEADPDLAGVYLLGKDIQRVASAETLEALLQIIRQDFDRLCIEMVKANRHLENIDERVVSRLRLLEKSLAQ